MRLCNICREIAGEEDSQFARVMGAGIVGAVFNQTADFRIIPSLGPLVVGHSLLVTNAHKTSICSSVVDWGSIAQIRTLIRQFCEVAVFDEPCEVFCFEHGVCDETSEPLCSTTHAHLHLVPLRRNTIREILGRHFATAAIEFGPDQIAAGIHGKARYILACSAGARGELQDVYIRDAVGVESQFMRRVIAEALDLGSGDWKDNPNLSILSRTISLGFQTLKHGHC